MDTVVSIVLAVPATAASARDEPVRRAFGWFAAVEAVCSRFDPASEVSRLAAEPGRPQRVSPMLLEILRLAWAVAEASAGAFNPAVGGLMEARGYDRDYRTGKHRRFGGGHGVVAEGDVLSYRDIVLDEGTGTVCLRRPLLLDLGAVAKGVAIDLAARELAGAPGLAIDAGGDVYVRGTRLGGRPWRVAIAGIRRAEGFLRELEPGDGAVATSGESARGPHILAGTGNADTVPAAVSVLAPNAALADALSTAAFAAGAVRGRVLLEATGDVEGLFVSRSGQVSTTSGFPQDVRGHL